MSMARSAWVGDWARVEAAPITAKIAGQQEPTSTSGTPAEGDSGGAIHAPVTPVWSARRFGEYHVLSSASPPSTGGSSSTPAAVRSSVRMECAAAEAEMVGTAPEATASGRSMVIESSERPTGTVRTTSRSPGPSLRMDPVSG